MNNRRKRNRMPRYMVVVDDIAEPMAGDAPLPVARKLRIAKAARVCAEWRRFAARLAPDGFAPLPVLVAVERRSPPMVDPVRCYTDGAAHAHVARMPLHRALKWMASDKGNRGRRAPRYARP